MRLEFSGRGQWTVDGKSTANLVSPTIWEARPSDTKPTGWTVNYGRQETKISTIALGLTPGMLCGAPTAGFAVVQGWIPDCGVEFFRLMGSSYLVVSGAGPLGRIIICAARGLGSGCLFSCLIGWIYNVVLSRVVML